MMYHYSSNLIPSTDHMVMGKRLYCELEKNLQSTWPSYPSKRPRKIDTPGSVISAITSEDDSSSYPSPSLPYPEGPFCPRFESLFDYPMLSTSSIGDTVAAVAAQPYREVKPAVTKLRSEKDIQADVSNSFEAGQYGTMFWTNELLVQVLSNEIEDLIYSNDDGNVVIDAGEFQMFYSSFKQPFELDFYMGRLVQYVNCSVAVFVTMFVYLDRVQEKCKALITSDMNCHRLVFTCLVLAVKYLEDEVHSNAYYARVGGLTADEMNNLEVKLLKVLDWNLNVTPETYSSYEEGLIQTAELLLRTRDGTHA